MSVLVTLMDGVDGALYKCLMTTENAERVKIDNNFAAFSLKKLMDTSNELTDERTMLQNTSYESPEVYDTSNDNPVIHETSTEIPEYSETNEIAITGVFKWPHDAILLLIEEYRIRAEDFYSGKVSQKKTWEAIENQLIKKGYNTTGPQCLSKYSGLKRTYKNIKDHNKKSGNGLKTWPYFNLVDSLIGSKPNIEPVATVSSTGKRQCSTKDGNSSETPNKKLKQVTVIEKIMLKIDENKALDEERRERRHQEKLQLKREALNILARMANTFEK